MMMQASLVLRSEHRGLKLPFFPGPSLQTLNPKPLTPKPRNAETESMQNCSFAHGRRFEHCSSDLQHRRVLLSNVIVFCKTLTEFGTRRWVLPGDEQEQAGQAPMSSCHPGNLTWKVSSATRRPHGPQCHIRSESQKARASYVDFDSQPRYRV